ncbi:MAG: acetylornithine/succinylornithine family transaminase [bacterium]|nr:MAG: acetylornithine/succinylornithine family transaminase [bacterium]
MIDYMEIQKQYEFDVYPKRDIVIVKGKGARVWDTQGNEYIDCSTGHGVANIGHCNEMVARAIAEQAQTLITCDGTYYNDKKALLLEKLISIAPSNLKKAFLCNSGTETIEAAIKFTRFSTRKKNFVCANRGFHGRTLGSLSATFQPKYKEDFEPLVPGFKFAPFNNFEKLAAEVDDQTAGIILEVVQGEGGIYIGDRDYFQQVRQLCDEKGIILIIDEVQTGFCRTGKMFACQHYDLQPDILCVAKSIAGGVPMGAVICSEELEIPAGKHGSTFGGNPLACAAAIAATDFMIDNKLDIQATEKGSYFMEKLNRHNSPRVREIRHIGLIIGIELKEKVTPYLVQLIRSGVLALPAGSLVLRLLPPLTISFDEVDEVVDKIIHVLKAPDD